MLSDAEPESDPDNESGYLKVCFPDDPQPFVVGSTGDSNPRGLSGQHESRDEGFGYKMGRLSYCPASYAGVLCYKAPGGAPNILEWMANFDLLIRADPRA